MADQTKPGTPEPGTTEKNSKGGKTRLMTFVYTELSSGEVVLGKHKSAQPTVNRCWDEYTKKHNLNPKEVVRHKTALAGDYEWMDNQIRKLTRSELEALCVQNKLI